MTTHSIRTAARERGAASIVIVIMLLAVITTAIYATQSITTSIRMDATAADQRVQALFLAETGLERAAQRFTRGAACSAASNETVTVANTGSFTLQFLGASTFDGTACAPATCGSSYCRVRSIGKVIPVNSTTAVNARTLETVLIPKTLTTPGTSSLTQNGAQYSLSNTVSPGTNQIFVLAVMWTNTKAGNKIGKITAVNYTGATPLAMTAAKPMPVTANDGYYAQIFYMKNPPAGTNPITIVFDSAPSGVSVGSVNADGVDPTTPIVAYGPFAGVVGATTLSNTIPNLPANGLVIDALGRNNGGNATGVTGVGSTFCNDAADPTVALVSMYSSNANKNASEASYCGPIGAAKASFVMGYTFTQALKVDEANYVQVVIQPDNTTSGGKRVRLGGSAGVLKWHEVVTTPP